MSKTESLTLTSVQVERAIHVAIKAKRPIFLWGAPGIGKSDVVAQIAADLNDGDQSALIDLRMSQLDQTDLRGIPVPNNDTKTMEWYQLGELPTPEFAKQYKTVVLFLDEMNSAAPSVQAVGYQLILNRRIGTYKLPDNVAIIAAGNRAGDKGVTYSMPKPLANRFVHIEMRPDFASWQDWAVNNGVHPDVVGYLSSQKQDLYEFDPKSTGHAFATPRSWVFVSDLIKSQIDSETMYSLVTGSVGEGLAIKFQAHRKHAAKLPNPSDILAGKVKELEVKELSAMYALTTSMCYELKDVIDNKTKNDVEFHEMVDNFLTFMMENFETELIVMGGRIAVTTYKLPIMPQKSKVFKNFLVKYQKYILAAK